MGCSNCNKETQSDTQTETIRLLPEGMSGDGIYNGHFLLKLITFSVLVLALPLFLVVIIGQVFLTFFFPKSVSGITSFFTNIFKNIGERYVHFKLRKNMKKREKQFNSGPDYHTYSPEDYVDAPPMDGDKILNDIEVFMKGDTNKKDKEM